MQARKKDQKRSQKIPATFRLCWLRQCWCERWGLRAGCFAHAAADGVRWTSGVVPVAVGSPGWWRWRSAHRGGGGVGGAETSEHEAEGSHETHEAEGSHDNELRRYALSDELRRYALSADLRTRRQALAYAFPYPLLGILYTRFHNGRSRGTSTSKPRT